jgi:hypothetical protein
MSEWRELSRLPQEPEYWAELRGRITGAAGPVVTARRARERWIDRGLAAGVLAAAAGVVLLLASPQASTPGTTLEAGLAPADPVAVELLNSGTAPPVGGLLAAYFPGVR